MLERGVDAATLVAALGAGPPPLHTIGVRRAATATALLRTLANASSMTGARSIRSSSSPPAATMTLRPPPAAPTRF